MNCQERLGTTLISLGPNLRVICLCLVGIWLLEGCTGGIKPNPKFRPTRPDVRQPKPGAAPSVPEGARKKTASGDVSRRSSFAISILDQVDRYLDVPYLWGGTTAKGMDCSGLVGTVYRKAVNFDLPRRARDMFRSGTPIAPEDLEFGDLVFFETQGSRVVSHVGIYLGDRTFVHASTKKGVSIAELDSDYYRRRFLGARRVYRVN